jgi:hypothetical protein
MAPESASIFDAALALPLAQRGALAAKLIESLEEESPPLPDRTPQEWDAIIKARSDALHRGEAELIDGQEIIDKLDAIIDRAGRKS